MRFLLTGLLIGFALGVYVMAEQTRREKATEEENFFKLADDIQEKVSAYDQRKQATDRFVEGIMGDA
ncbi:MAG: hypothetical protein K8L97_32775 [Anaerolineae bacterium]|nr:hypothetical protein [Anaerolineae bacterium]